jgi:hypothetical protein
MLGARATSNATGEDSLTLDGVRRDRPAWRSALAPRSATGRQARRAAPTKIAASGSGGRHILRESDRPTLPHGTTCREIRNGASLRGRRILAFSEAGVAIDRAIAPRDKGDGGLLTALGTRRVVALSRRPAAWPV